MKRFRFTLEAVERFRKSREEEAMRLLAEAQRKLREAMDHRQQLELALEQALQERENLGKTAVEVSAFQVVQNYIAGLKQQLLHAENEIRKSKKGVDRAMKFYLNARRQTRVIELLHDKQLQTYKKERLKYELKQQDDINTMRNRLTHEEGEAA